MGAHQFHVRLSWKGSSLSIQGITVTGLGAAHVAPNCCQLVNNFAEFQHDAMILQFPYIRYHPVGNVKMCALSQMSAAADSCTV